MKPYKFNPENGIEDRVNRFQGSFLQEHCESGASLIRRYWCWALVSRERLGDSHIIYRFARYLSAASTGQ